MPAVNTREEWLVAAIRELEKCVFANPELVGREPVKMPEKWKVTCGWCKGMSSKGVACCVPKGQSKDGTTHLFVVPTEDNPWEVLSHLVHEMIHASDDCASGHAGHFKEVMKRLGLDGKPTKCGVAKGSIADRECQGILQRLGPYPHQAMAPRKKPTKPSPWVRWKSKTWPKYTVLINTKKVIQYGIPRDPKGDEMMPVDPEKVFGIKADPRQETLFDEPSGEDDDE